MEYNFQIGNKRIFVEVLGPSNAPALLYIHGGPGAGSYDFKLHQAEELSRHCKVIMVDQRGVLRSEHLEKSENLSPLNIINDFEAIRAQLNIKSWAILGHSFGGYLALIYINQYPSVISRVIFECPTFDIGLSACSLIKRAADEFCEIGNYEKAYECKNAVLAYKDAESIWDKMYLLNDLGERRNNIYVFHKERNFFENIIKDSELPQEAWEGSYLHSEKLSEEGSIFKSALPLLKDINCPALLIKGKYDHVTSQEQISAFRSQVPKGKIVEFSKSGHFPRFEEAKLFSETVIDFIFGN